MMYFLTKSSGLYPGLTENEIATVLDNALRAAGMEPFFDIVLFGSSHPAHETYDTFTNVSKMRMHQTPMAERMEKRFWSQKHLS
jgi:hypothetical protein